jgi:FdhD protein
MTFVDRSFRYYKYSGVGWEPVESRVISEATVSLTVNSEAWLNFRCTPAYLEALAVGFLYNEGFISNLAEVVSVHTCAAGDNVDVWLSHAVERPTQWHRTSGCNGGLTQSIAPRQRPINVSKVQISPKKLLDCTNQLLASQELYRQAGGIHCSALSDGISIYYQAEDIGRHNTLDKLAGQFLLGEKEFFPKIVLTTGRVSSEMMQKSANLGADVVLSRTSPTTRSIEMAEETGITLIGYARRTQLLVYSHPERLEGFSEANSFQNFALASRPA